MAFDWSADRALPEDNYGLQYRCCQEHDGNTPLCVGCYETRVDFFTAFCPPCWTAMEKLRAEEAAARVPFGEWMAARH